MISDTFKQVQPNRGQFVSIAYRKAKEVNYLADFVKMRPPNATFLEQLNYNQLESSKERSPFDSIADQLYKKIVKQGYIEKPSKVSRKNKRGDSEFNYYNANDDFINDDQCCIQKKDKFSNFEDYACINTTIQAFYESQLYKEKVEDLIIQVNKRKSPDQFNPNNQQDIEKFDEIKKKIKKSILAQVQLPKQELPQEQPQNVGEKHEEKLIIEEQAKPSQDNQ